MYPPRLLDGLNAKGMMPHDAATVEHLVDKNQDRDRPPGTPLVMACYQCNHDKGVEAHMAVPKEIRREWTAEGMPSETLPEEIMERLQQLKVQLS